MRRESVTRTQGGAATMLALAVAVVLVLVAVVAAAAVSLSFSQHRAATAADLAALAAAAAAERGGDPCAVAARLARENHAALASCRLSGLQVQVVVVVHAVPFEQLSWTIRGRARAGPS